MEYLGYNYINTPNKQNIDELLKISKENFQKFDISQNCIKGIHNILNKNPKFKDKLLYELIIPKIFDFYKHVKGSNNNKEKNKVDSIFSKFKGSIKEISSENYGLFVIQELIKNVEEEQLK